jgi:hypothetical protein
MTTKKKAKAAKSAPKERRPAKFKQTESETTVTDMSTGKVLDVINNKEKLSPAGKVPDDKALAANLPDKKTPDSELKKLEKQIEDEGGKSYRAYLNVGKALFEIEKDKLYEGKYKNFVEYCNERWGYSRTYSFDLMGAYNVYNSLAAIASAKQLDEVFTNESQLRPFKKLKVDEDRLLVFNKLVEKSKDKPITAEIVKEKIACFDIKTKKFSDKPIQKRSPLTPSTNKLSLKKTDIEITESGLSFSKLDDEKIKNFHSRIIEVLSDGGSIEIICKPKKVKNIVTKKDTTQKKKEK